MTDKMPVLLRPTTQTVHTYERLKQCSRCGTYSVLWHESCLECGSQRKFLSVHDIVRGILRRNLQRDLLLMAAGSLAAYFLARSFEQMAAAIAGGVLLIVLYVLLRRRYSQTLRLVTLRKLLQRESFAIREGLLLDVQDAASDIESENFKEAYEKLREIGFLITGNHIRVLKAFCLNRFILRSDMELELSSLIPDEFEPSFVYYLNEICKVSPQLVKRDTLDYVMKHRIQIGGMIEGRATLALVAAAALRVKEYVFEYSSLLYDFVDDLPRERLLRLCRLLGEHHDRAAQLHEKAQETARRKYEFDPEFQGFI
ncbi:hypothetical protein [Paenibacillus lutrae]|uniref:Uncharacterized protein n=1 Tax=Paenibacillus lutrae TaxID=2078573 RepID=A0A7X3FG80_9BACL|nr:hypothetical protein [Paenibacillus lutrae]MVO98816.1 hypothetical protein [Paenibacillus lutrae]